MTPFEQSITRLMQLNRDMTKDAEFEAALRDELCGAYRRGFVEASRRYDIYKEDMGK